MTTRRRHGSSKGDNFRKDSPDITPESFEENEFKLNRRKGPKPKTRGIDHLTKKSSRRNDKNKYTTRDNRDTRIARREQKEGSQETSSMRNLGIYNKSRISETIHRGQPQHVRTIHDIRTRTEDDIAKVLDCSEFRLNPVPPSLDQLLPDVHHDSSSAISATPTSNHINSPRSVHSSCHSTISALSSNEYQHHNSDVSSNNLKYKTPLKEISESLLSSLRPKETFHGSDYFSGVREELRKLHRQSLASREQNLTNLKGLNDVTGHTAKRKHIIDQENRPLSIKRQRKEAETSTVQTTADEVLKALKSVETHTANVSMPEQPASFSQISDPHLLNPPTAAPCEVKKMVLSSDWEKLRACDNRVMYDHVDAPIGTASYDILDFLDNNVIPCKDTKTKYQEQDAISWEPPAVSPPKKTWLQSPSPPKFYRRKLY
ncbi:uncharacterized protein LOC116614203 isoform X2 [Nematostella vectensis]|uniref:uncharacterized protein LOC116614203 isoform X2 n=1 Tax=Nematostella vectensis TaxID=45351 RepID=UPI00207748E5|nr:uncharacterized protein LOC116614203 isoform X2 [Nematostella vectensis]